MKKKEKTKQIRIRKSSHKKLVKLAGKIPLVEYASDIIDAEHDLCIDAERRKTGIK